ncbi:hypothetical protein [Enterococcus plantarum]|uniref:hypothetical protein n=1 Tax=Enterococcus plantarum TaxID=1077675 RepID=UPI0015E88664|nr:hypothetical protein [Enterococcus plantarum]
MMNSTWRQEEEKQPHQESPSALIPNIQIVISGRYRTNELPRIEEHVTARSVVSLS